MPKLVQACCFPAWESGLHVVCVDSTGGLWEAQIVSTTSGSSCRWDRVTQQWST